MGLQRGLQHIGVSTRRPKRRMRCKKPLEVEVCSHKMLEVRNGFKDCTVKGVIVTWDEMELRLIDTETMKTQIFGLDKTCGRCCI